VTDDKSLPLKKNQNGGEETKVRVADQKND